MKKRLTTFLSLSTMSISCFAYGDYGYGENSLNIGLPSYFNLMVVIIIAVGVLEAILFFKIWGMTNDVEKLKNHIIPDTTYGVSAVRDLWLKGKVEQAYDALNSFMVDRINQAYNESREYQDKEKAIENFRKKVEDLCTKNEPTYKAIGREIPETIMNLSYEQFKNFGV